MISLLNIDIFMKDISFAGLANFLRLVADERVSNATFHTLYFALLEVPLQIVLGLFLTMFVATETLRSRLYRSIYYLPFICSMTAVSIIWSMLLDPNMGLVPYVLNRIGIGTIAFLKDPNWAMPTIVAVTVWKGFGYTLTLLSAAALNISDSLYEAADMDGAGNLKKFLHITIPSIWPTISFCIVTTTISALQVFDQAYVMTKGGPLNKTETVVLYIFDRGFETAPYDLGYASAVSVYLFGIIAVVTFILRKFVLSKEDASDE
jgi:multiple sugar transport system permease protein